jgi:hypothetical protein
MLKVLYPADNDRAPWALLAYRRGWLTFTEYALIPPTEMGPLERMFAAGPFTKFLRKRSW